MAGLSEGPAIFLRQYCDHKSPPLALPSRGWL
jgi:hypothetical protein